MGDMSGQSATKTVNYVVNKKDTTDNLVVIYYVGYYSPYIHYQVENGSWTNAPGYKMTATDEKDGYSHKYVINLGDKNYANVCFNDGNGNWDSNNGKNYRFNKGTYTFKNGVITPVEDDKFGIESFDITPADGKITVGDFIDMKVKLKNATSDAVSKFTYLDSNNHEVTIYDYAGASSCLWQFNKSGTYRVRVYSKESYGSTNYVMAEKTVTVDKASENVVTIYYKGYSTPYIHYQVGNGSWTDAPGNKMTSTNEKTGYTHKYTIDLGTSTYANVCFNNGNGSWDSRNGQNYHFEKGTYTFSNGNMTKIAD